MYNFPNFRHNPKKTLYRNGLLAIPIIILWIIFFWAQSMFQMIIIVLITLILFFTIYKKINYFIDENCLYIKSGYFYKKIDIISISYIIKYSSQGNRTKIQIISLDENMDIGAKVKNDDKLINDLLSINPSIKISE